MSKQDMLDEIFKRCGAFSSLYPNDEFYFFHTEDGHYVGIDKCVDLLFMYEVNADRLEKLFKKEYGDPLNLPNDAQWSSSLLAIDE